MQVHSVFVLNEVVRVWSNLWKFKVHSGIAEDSSLQGFYAASAGK
jgi:hypothetical protein